MLKRLTRKRKEQNLSLIHISYFYYADYEKITISPIEFLPDRHGVGFGVYMPGGEMCIRDRVVVELRNGTSYGHQWMELIIDARYLDLVIVECCAANINKIGFGML